MKGIIDRFEGDCAVVEFEGRTIKNIRKDSLPPGIKAGSVVVFINGEWHSDEKETVKLKEEINDLINKLFED